MTSERKQIREGFKATLIAAATDVGDRVSENRVHPFFHKSLPAACIFTRSEDISINAEGPRLYVRDAEVVVQVVLDGERDVDDRCDVLCGELERAIELSAMIDEIPALARIELQRVEGPEINRDGTRTVCGANLVYLARYEQEITADDSDFVELETVATEIETDEQREGAELTDELSLADA